MRYLLVGILAIAIVLRLVGIRFGLPFDVMGDEFVHIFTGFTLLEEMTLRATSPLSYVPSLFAITMLPFVVGFGALGMVLGAFDGLAAFKEFAVMNATDFLSIGRVISALFGVLFVYLIYKIARPLAGYWPAIIVTILAALDFWLIHESNKSHFWMPATTLLTLGVYFLLRLAETGRFKYYWGVVGSMAFGIWMGFFPIILAPFFALAHLHAPARTFRYFLYSTIALIAAFLAIAWLNPLSILKQFGRAIRSALDVVGIDVFPQFVGPSDNPTDPLQNLYFLLHTLFFDNPFVFVLGVVGFVLLVYKLSWRSFTVQLIAGLFVAYLGMALFIWPHPDHRYILPLILPLLIGTSYTLSVLYQKFYSRPWGKPAAAVLAVLVIGYSLYLTASYGALLLKSDTRILAREWIFEHVPNGTAIYTDAVYFDLPKSREAIEYYAKVLPEALRAKDRTARTFTDDRFPQPAYFVIENRYGIMPVLKDLKYTYMVVGYFDPAKRKEIPAGFERVAAFYAGDPDKPADDLLINPSNIFTAVGSVSRLGPHVEIYRRVE